MGMILYDSNLLSDILSGGILVTDMSVIYYWPTPEKLAEVVSDSYFKRVAAFF